MIQSIAWKNIWRNKKRSLVVIIAVTLGIISGVLLVGIMEGWVKQRLHDAIYNEVSHIQIHHAGYTKNEEIDLTVDKTDELRSMLDSLQEVAGWAARTKLVAMAVTPWATTGLFIYGVDPEKEKQVTEISAKVLPEAGSYLSRENPGDILISDKTAEILKLKQYIITGIVADKLKAKNIPGPVLEKLLTLKDVRYRSPGDFREALKALFTRKALDRYGSQIMEEALDYRIRSKVQITISDQEGNPVQGVFRICGIFKTSNTGFDQTSVFVNAEKLAELYGGDRILIHEVSVLLKDMDKLDEIRERLGGISGINSVRNWKELAPDAAMMNDFMVIYYFIFTGIIMLALAFGIINTMLMSILERTRELGMLMAIGMNRKRIFRMIMLETVFLTFTGALAGMFTGWIIAELLGKTGIHFTGWGEGFEAIGYAAVVYPEVKPGFILFTAVLVIITAVLSALWPARKALKLIPVEALRTE